MEGRIAGLGAGRAGEVRRGPWSSTTTSAQFGLVPGAHRAGAQGPGLRLPGRCTWPKNEQFTESYAAVSASRLVPLLRDGEHTVLTQSLAIIEYLEETHPEPPCCRRPGGPRPGAGAGAGHRLRDPPAEQPARAALPGADLKLSEDDKNRWYRHWVETGLEVVERQLAARPPPSAMAEAPTLADSAGAADLQRPRFDCRLDHVPQVMRVFDACMKLDAFEQTRPEHCPDAGLIRCCDPGWSRRRGRRG
jgi:glutathione S-transferase